MNVDQLERRDHAATKAIMPVHFTGNMTDMRKLMPIAERHKLPVVEDACQCDPRRDRRPQRRAPGARPAGFSLHPLKNLNVWGDGGVIVTNDDGARTTSCGCSATTA